MRNVHEREIPAPAEAVGRLLDGLGTHPDPLWPEGPWPAMRFDRPLEVGALGGHGPIRYRVERYEPRRRVLFRFTGPPGLQGTHEFSVAEAPGGSFLRHAIEGRTSGAMRLSWPLVFRPLHDALIEDALDKAESTLTGIAVPGRPWSLRVRMLRRLARGRG